MGVTWGLTRTAWEHGPRITIQSLLFREVGVRAVEDTMVHEMVDVWLAVTGQDTKHGSKAWYAAVRGLSPEVLGHELDARRAADRRSVRVRTDDGHSVVRKVVDPVSAAVPHKVVAA